MNASFSLPGILKPVKKILQRFHFVLFMLFLAGSLALAIFTLNSLVTRSQQESTIVPQQNFDTQTIERINELRTRNDEEQSIELPAGRINPFVE